MSRFRNGNGGNERMPSEIPSARLPFGIERCRRQDPSNWVILKMVKLAFGGRNGFLLRGGS